MKTLRLALLAALLAPLPAGQAATVTDYSSLHILGDSLSDIGNVHAATFGQIPESPPYFDGRFSNGPVWAERFADLFQDEDLPTGNHAWGGAQARANRDASPDLDLQALRYLRLDSDRRGDRPLLALWAGGNDILNGSRERGIRRVGRDAADAVADTAEDLADAGVADFLILNLPDLGRIPDSARASDPAVARRASAGSRAFNRRLAGNIGDMRDDGLTVTGVNIFRFFNEFLDDPAAFGVRNVRRPCIEDGEVCGRRAARRRAFFDDIHPNRVVHRRISEIVAREMFGNQTLVLAAAAPRTAPAAVPLPAPALTLAAGLALLGAVARRRRT